LADLLRAVALVAEDDALAAEAHTRLQLLLRLQHPEPALLDERTGPRRTSACASWPRCVGIGSSTSRLTVIRQ
jgi:hypothetical protein